MASRSLFDGTTWAKVYQFHRPNPRAEGPASPPSRPITRAYHADRPREFNKPPQPPPPAKLHGASTAGGGAGVRCRGPGCGATRAGHGGGKAASDPAGGKTPKPLGAAGVLP